MMRVETLSCDWCEHKDDSIADDPVEMGWLFVEVYDMMAEEIRNLDFCCKECLVNYFE